MSSASQSPRFGYWLTFFLVSVVTLCALIEARAHTDRLSPAAQANQDYAVACCTVLSLLSLLVVFLHTRPLLIGLIMGTKLEGGTILILITFWSALVAIVSDTRHGLATDSSGSISNGNIYYFSWAGLATGVALMLSYVRSVWGIDLTAELRNSAKRLQYWAFLFIVGAIQMGSSARLYDNHCGRSSAGLGEEKIGSIKFCRRCQLGIAIGILSSIASMAVIGVKLGVASSGNVPWLYTIELVLSGTLVVFQAVGVALLTSQGGPGAPLNNIFYSSWGSLSAGLVLTASCIEDWSTASWAMKARAHGAVSVLGEEGESLGLRDGFSRGELVGASAMT